MERRFSLINHETSLKPIPGQSAISIEIKSGQDKIMIDGNRVEVYRLWREIASGMGIGLHFTDEEGEKLGSKG